jgi:hypothetical protein
MNWIIALYIVPLVALIFILMWRGENPFTKVNAWIVFTPLVNLYYFLLEYMMAILFFLMSWGEFVEDIVKSFKKYFINID